MFEPTPTIRAFLDLAQERKLPARQTILHAGDRPTSLYLVLEGSVSIQLEDHHGREIVLAYLNSGQFFGEIGLFPDQVQRTASARTRMPTVVAELPYEEFRSLASDHPQLMVELAGQLAKRLSDTSRRVSDLAYLDVAGRLARTLLQLCRQPEAVPDPRGMVIRCRRQDIARLCGCTREVAGRVIQRLEEDGMLLTLGHRILVYSAPPRRIAGNASQARTNTALLRGRV